MSLYGVIDYHVNYLYYIRGDRSPLSLPNFLSLQS